MKKVLLVIPEKSYKSNDFVVAAKRLKIPFSIITDSQQVSESLTDNIIISNFDEDISPEVLMKLKDITHVFNYDMPRFSEDYIHRIGRTGRADKKGYAISFVSPSDKEYLRKIERFTEMKIMTKVVAGKKLWNYDALEPTEKKGAI